MANLTIKNIPDDVLELLNIGAHSMGTSQNQYVISILTQASLLGLPSLQALLPDTIQYLVKSIIMADEERKRAYFAEMVSIMKDTKNAIERFETVINDLNETLPQP